jgi:cell division ATPase FtsA
VVTGGASRMADFEQFLAQETGMPIRFGSFAHYLDAESVDKYSDTEYTLLVGLLLNATEECIQERKVEEPEKNQPIAPKKEKKSSSWKDIFNVKVGTLFDDPEEPTIK